VFLTQSQDASTDDDLVELRKIDLKIAAVCTWTVINNKLDEKVIAWFKTQNTKFIFKVDEDISKAELFILNNQIQKMVK
jgi:hypothetical protein